MNMFVKTLTRFQAKEAMKEWMSTSDLPLLSDDYNQIRQDIQAMNKAVRDELSNTSCTKSNYYIDYHMGLRLYEYFANKGFSLRVAANIGFWRYLSVIVVPDVVSQRWGNDNEAHFWRQPSRIWLSSLWWFVYLSWQGSLEKTEELLSCNNFSTDTILNFVERPGRNGTQVDTYRQIIYCYSKISESSMKKLIKDRNGQDSKDRDDIFRIVMKLNTARMMVMDPVLCEGGVSYYAESLFKDVGVDLNVA